MTSKPATLLIAYVPAMVWAGFLIYLGSRTLLEPLPDLLLPADKLGHLALYGLLGTLTVLGWRWAGRRPALPWPIFGAMAVGIVDELNQRTVATRSADVFDWIVDALAILIAFTLLGRRTNRPEHE